MMGAFYSKEEHALEERANAFTPELGAVFAEYTTR